MSKAAERSKSVRRETLRESSAWRMSCISLRRAVSVRVVSGLRRDGEIVFGEAGKQLLENNLL